MKHPLLKLIPIVVLVALTTPVQASAYTDPGTGTFIYQAAYAAVLAGTFYIRRILDRFWKRRK
ncbi:MAG: hypothetical protein ABI823_01630 [Bryobacteraceae bacterium]